MLDYCLDIAEQSVWSVVTPSEAARRLPFCLTEIGLFYAGARYYTHRAGREGYYLLYTKSGCGELEIDGEHYRIPSGSVLLVDCLPEHLYRTCPGADWVNYWIHLEGTGAAAYFSLLEFSPVELVQRGEFEDTLESLLQIASRTDIASLAQTSQYLSSLLTAMLQSQMGNRNGTMLPDSIQSALAYIREHYASPITIDDITRSAGLSKFHFVRVFNRYIGTTPYHYLINHRITQAKRLLCTTGLSVAQISARVGYQSESNFIQQFNRLCTMTPTQYRRRNLSYPRQESNTGRD